MPLRDWQFWVVTGAALAALVVAVRALLGRRAKKPKKVGLTVERRRVR